MNGFERRDQPGARVIIIGAGMAGLVAGYELARAGHDPVIVEAQNCVGGRIYTLRRFAPGPRLVDEGAPMVATPIGVPIA